MSLSENLTPGAIDGFALRAFKYGACGALAIAVHDELGWPIVAITDSHNVHNGRAGGGSALHWAVRHPSGKLLDVDGLHEPAELTAEYHGEADEGKAAFGLSSRADCWEWYVESQGEPVSIDLARTFVAPLLKKLGPGMVIRRDRA